MAPVDALRALAPEMTSWRHQLHARPETAFQERETSDFIARTLGGLGLQVHRGLAGTGVVGTLASGQGPAIGLRADMDALPLTEAVDRPYRSTTAGTMHACGHDGHMAMLLGAARYLAERRTFLGTVHFIFQPAEENEAGGRVMVDDGLFRLFPVQAVYGMHNWPGLPAGRFAIRPGPLMAACDLFEITVDGKGCHGAMPHLGTDAIVAASALIQALQTIVSRTIDPQEPAVVSVTQVHAGETWNVLPARAVIRGTVRAFDETVQDRIEAAIRRLAQGTALALGLSAAVTYRRQYPATVNHAPETEQAARAAAQVVGEANVERNPTPTMGSEDFAFMLRERPGAYIWIGAGTGADDVPLHSPRYDFNDGILALGACYWATLVESLLPREAVETALGGPG